MSRVVIAQLPRSRGSLLQRLLTGMSVGSETSCSANWADWWTAVDEWSRVLNSGSKLAFLVRDEKEIEESMRKTRQLWETFGKTDSERQSKVAQIRQNMVDFCEMNPKEAVMLFSDRLLDFDQCSKELEPFVCGLNHSVWFDSVAEITRGWRAMADVRADASEEVAPTRRSYRISLGERKKNVVKFGPGYRKDDGRRTVEVKPRTEGVFSTNIIPGTDARTDWTVCTLRYGDVSHLKVCTDSFDVWAKNVGVTPVILDHPGSRYPSPKFCVFDALRNFVESSGEMFLYVDSDVLIKPDAPLPALTGHAFWLRPDNKRYWDDPGAPNTYQHWDVWAERMYGAREEAAKWTYLNAGIWACDRESAERFLAYVKPPFYSAVQEQNQFNWWLLQAVRDGAIDLKVLPTGWGRYFNEPGDSWFTHFVSRRGKEALLKIAAT